VTCTAIQSDLTSNSNPCESTPREPLSRRCAGGSKGFFRGVPMGFTKLDEGIVLSSVWSESCEVRVVWIALLAMADQNGIIHASLPGLARSANVPMDVVQSALEKFKSPDPFSRTKDNDGRRVEEVDGGWLLLNYAKYRRWSYSDSPDAVKKRHQRTKGDMSPNVPTSEGHSASSSVSSSVSFLSSKPRSDTNDVSTNDEPAKEDGLHSVISSLWFRVYEELKGSKPAWISRGPTNYPKMIQALAEMKRPIEDYEKAMRNGFADSWHGQRMELKYLVDNFNVLLTFKPMPAKGRALNEYEKDAASKYDNM